MGSIRPILLLLLVVAATGGTAYWGWPDLGPALGAAFAGFLVLHIYAVARLRRLERALADRPARARSAPAGSGRPEGRKSPKVKKKAESSAATAPAGRVVKPGHAGRSPTDAAADEPERVEEFLKVVLDDADAEEVSFLPPYASDEAEAVSFLEPYASGGEGEGATRSPEAPSPGGSAEGPDEVNLGEMADEVELPAEAYRNVPIPRHFALGTVAIIRNTLTPAEVAQVLVEQRKRPRERFGELAVEMGLLTGADLKELLVAQQQGLFTDEQIREARGRIKAFRELEAAASAQ